MKQSHFCLLHRQSYKNDHYLCEETKRANVSKRFEEKCLSKAFRQERVSSLESSCKYCSNSCTAPFSSEEVAFKRLLALFSTVAPLADAEVATLSGDDDGSVRAEGDEAF